MEPLEILRSEPLDLLFENRNKSYGAYTLRKYYPQRLLISLGFVLSLVAGLSVFLLFFHSGMPVLKVPDVPDVITCFIEPPPVKTVLPPAKPVFARPRTEAFMTMKIVKEDRLPQPPPAIENLKLSEIGLRSSPGPRPTDSHLPMEYRAATRGQRPIPSGKRRRPCSGQWKSCLNSPEAQKHSGGSL